MFIGAQMHASAHDYMTTYLFMYTHSAHEYMSLCICKCTVHMHVYIVYVCGSGEAFSTA